MNFMGAPIIESPLAVTKVEARIRGGYMNRWLIRGFVEQPCMFHDLMNKRFYVHPSLMPALRDQPVMVGMVIQFAGLALRVCEVRP